MPRFAIVIPAHACAAVLPRALAAIGAQNYPAPQVIVAIDGADSALESIARDAGATVVVLATNSGSYAARNAAIAAIDPDVEYVAFTDADCIPAPGWLRGHAVALAHADLSGGAVIVTRRERPSPAEYVDQSRHLRQEHYVRHEGYAATANLAVRRDVLRAVQFKAELRSGGDNDFGHRALALGYVLDYAPAAVVEHPARQTSAEVKEKVNRIVAGIRANPQRWSVRPVPRSPLRARTIQRAKQETAIANPWWLWRVWLLQRRCDLTIHRAVSAVRSSQFRDVAQGAGLRIAAFVDTFPSLETYPPSVVDTFVSHLDELSGSGDSIAVVAIEQRPGLPRSMPVHYLQLPCTRLGAAWLALRMRATHPLRYQRFSARARALSLEVGNGEGLIRKRWLVEAAHVLGASKPQVLVAHGAWGSSAAADCISTLLKLPWVMVMHGDDLYRRRLNLPEKLASATELITTSRYCALYLRREITLRRPVDEIPLGVALPRTEPRTPTYDLVCAAALTPASGIDTLIYAVDILHYGRPSVRLEIIGDGPQRAELERLVTSLRLQEHVIFHGELPRAAALGRIGQARIFCLLPRIANDGDRDPLPMAIKDALALGVPVVSRSVLSIDQVMDTSCGVMLEKEDPSELAEVLRIGLRLAPQDRAELGAQARRRAGEVAGIAESARQLRDVFVLATKERERGSYVAGD